MARLQLAFMLDTGRVKQERERQQLSMAAAARLAGMTAAQTWERIENGNGLSLTLRTLNKIAKALGIPARDLLKPAK